MSTEQNDVKPSPPTLRVPFDGGKYHIVQDATYRVDLLKHGEPLDQVASREVRR